MFRLPAIKAKRKSSIDRMLSFSLFVSLSLVVPESNVNIPDTVFKRFVTVYIYMYICTTENGARCRWEKARKSEESRQIEILGPFH